MQAVSEPGSHDASFLCLPAVGLTPCGGVCTSIMTDPYNCGMVSSSGQHEWAGCHALTPVAAAGATGKQRCHADRRLMISLPLPMPCCSAGGSVAGGSSAGQALAPNEQSSLCAVCMGTATQHAEAVFPILCNTINLVLASELGLGSCSTTIQVQVWTSLEEAAAGHILPSSLAATVDAFCPHNSAPPAPWHPSVPDPAL